MQEILADVPLATFLEEQVVPYEVDEVTRLIVDGPDAGAFAPVAAMTVGEVRDHLLDPGTDTTALKHGLTPEMVAATSTLMRFQDLIAVARRTPVVTALRSTVGLPGTMATRLQPDDPTDDPVGVMASIVDGLLLGCGDAVIGINPATDSPQRTTDLLRLLDEVRPATTSRPRAACSRRSGPRWRSCSGERRSTWCSRRSPVRGRPTRASA